MFTGFFINLFYPFLGILKPISIIPLIATISFIVLILSILCYYNNKNSYNYTYITAKYFFSPKSLFLFLIPFLAVYGAYLVNNYHSNNLIIICIILISLIILLFGFSNFIPKHLYPLVIFTLGLSLLFHNSLISNYLWGCDIQNEYHLANVVMNNSFWNSEIEQNINAMLSIVILGPIISNICNIDLVWIFKIIFPLVFSLLPLGMYKIFERQTNEEIAFISCIFFITCFSFYTEMLALARQQIAELFFVLLFLLMVNPFIDNSKKAILSIIFSFSIVVSHYAFTYLFIAAFVSSVIITKLIKKIDARYVNILNVASNIKQVPFEKFMNYNFIILLIVFTLSWYIYISRGSSFSLVWRIGDAIINSISNDFLNPKKAQGLEMMMNQAVSQMRNITKYFHMTSIFFISIGLFKSIVKKRSTNFNNAYIAFSISYFLICILGITIPLFASQMNTSRIYHISLITLAPFFSIGGISFFNVVINHKVNVFWRDVYSKQALKLSSIFLALFFLFNSGLIYEIKLEESSSVSLNNTHYPFIYNPGDVSTVKWLNSNGNNVDTIYADLGGGNLLGSITFDYVLFDTFLENRSLPKKSLIFFTTTNNKSHQIYLRNRFGKLEYVDVKYLNEHNKISNIYYNGYGKIGYV